MKKLSLRLMVIAFLVMIAGQALAWHDRTHVAIAKAAGYEYWFNAAGADITRSKAGDKEGNNHYFDNPRGETVGSKMVLDQAGLYDRPEDKEEGHLYGAIIASIREHGKLFDAGKYVGYHMAFAAHYIGDLSMPNHNIPFMIRDGFPGNEDEALTWHRDNDGVVESIVLNQPEEITKRMYIITLRADQFEANLAAEIARIANLSRDLGEKLRAGRWVMKPEEAFNQLGHSASLLRAVLEYYSRKK
jgi:hypothetical protein